MEQDIVSINGFQSLPCEERYRQEGSSAHVGSTAQQQVRVVQTTVLVRGNLVAFPSIVLVIYACSA